MRITMGKVNIVLAVILAFVFVAVLFLPVNPLEIRSAKVIGTSFKAGGEMSFEIDRCKNVDASVAGTASRYFVHVDEKGNVIKEKPPIFISSTDDLGEKGCAKVKRTIDIPAHVKDGNYKIKFVTRYFPSVLREPIKVEYTTKDVFTIQGQELSARLENVLGQLQVIQEELGIESQQVAVEQEQEPSNTPSMANVAPLTQPQQPQRQLDTISPTPQTVETEQEQQSRSLIQDILEVTNNITKQLPDVKLN